MRYIHKNCGGGEVSVKDSDGTAHLLKPNWEIELSRKSEGNGVKIIQIIDDSGEEIEKTQQLGKEEPKKKQIKTKESEI